MKSKEEKINVLGSIAFLSLHIACLGVVFTGVSAVAIGVGILLYWIRMFAITAGYHRYFSHRSYKTSRFFQFALGFLGASAGQLGPLWWASHHRRHHNHSDKDLDVHSPIKKSFWWAHMGWILADKYVEADLSNVKDLTKYPELRFIDRYSFIAPIVLAFFTAGLGALLSVAYPSLGTSAWQMLFWGFFVSTVLLYHCTFLVNSACHRFGKQRFATNDNSRNNFWVAFLTMGEGWHNNHHRYPFSEKQGINWWEIDFSHYTLRFLSLMGFVWDLKERPKIEGIVL